MGAALTTFADLKADVLDRVGELNVAGGDFVATVERQLVRGYHTVCNRLAFLFLRRNPPQAFVTIAPITAGTVSLTNGSATVTFSAAPAVSVQGRKVLVGSDWYRITAHTAASPTATLDTVYTGPTAAAATYTVFQDEYDLASDTRHLVELVVAESGVQVDLRDEGWLRANYPVPRQGFPPKACARIGETRIRFSTYPDRARRIEVADTVIPTDIDADTDGSLIRVPRNFRYVLSDYGVYWTREVMADRRAAAALVLAEKGLEGLIADDSRKRVSLAPARPGASGPYP